MRAITALAGLGLYVGSALAANGLLGHPDESWITLSGEVQSVQDGSFTLDYGTGSVTVEVGGWGRFGDLRDRLSGKQVSVQGEVDDDLFGATRVEASSVYVKDLQTYFFTRASEDDAVFWFDLARPGEDADATLRGTISSVGNDAFTVDTGQQQIRVNTTVLRDAEKRKPLQQGMLVRVTGDLASDFLDSREMTAVSVMILQPDGPSPGGRTTKGRGSD